MPRAAKSRDKRSNVDIFRILSETASRAKKERRASLLASTGVKEFFADGGISIDKKTCRGVECKLCIKACPTNALFWKTGEVGIVEELCVFCGACVLCCIVDDCIKVWRKRPTGAVERFSKPRDFVNLQHSINLRMRHERIKEVFPTTTEYLRYRKKKKQKTRRARAFS